jgi:hypothetical protein
MLDSIIGGPTLNKCTIPQLALRRIHEASLYELLVISLYGHDILRRQLLRDLPERLLDMYREKSEGNPSDRATRTAIAANRIQPLTSGASLAVGRT